jgi:isopenicillin N synthase-like dioxygenase
MAATKHLNQADPARAMDRDRLPLIDLAPLFDPAGQVEPLIKKIGKSCLETGFFYVRNTCVTDRVIDQAVNAMKSFFDCPDSGSIKQSVHNRNAGGMKGWGPMFGEPAYQKDTVAHMESFDFGQQLGDEDYHSLGIEGNIWPDITGFRTAMIDYYESLTLLGRALATVFSRMLGESPDFINSASGLSAPRTMRMLHYPANEAAGDARNVGISAHTDFECFTILYQTAAGLELTNQAGQWVQAPSGVGTFTVILGDMLERFSNGHFKATGHRVANTPWTRYSMVLFFAVDGNCRVQPLSQFVSEARPAAYSPVTQDEHIETELQRAASNHAESG